MLTETLIIGASRQPKEKHGKLCGLGGRLTSATTRAGRRLGASCHRARGERRTGARGRPKPPAAGTRARLAAAAARPGRRAGLAGRGPHRDACPARGEEAFFLNFWRISI